MVRRTARLTLLGMALLVALGPGVGHAAAPTGHLVLLAGGTLQPASLTVAKGAVVIWLNRTKSQPVSLTFEASPSPDPTCNAGVGFVRRDSQVFTLPALPPGGTASLCFPAAGTHSYMVHGLERPVSGAVTVGGAP